MEGGWEFGAEEREERDVVGDEVGDAAGSRSPVVGEPEAGKSAEPVASHIDRSLVENAKKLA